MLKIYNVRYYVSINTAPWERIDSQGTLMLEESQVVPERIQWNNLSFLECIDVLKANIVTCIHLYEYGFKRKPCICIRYAGDWESTTYKHFDTISLKATYVEDPYYTLADIIKRFPADQTIQYLKERGIATCPMLKE